LSFPGDFEPRTKRKALNLCQDHLRKVIETTRKVTLLMESFLKNDKKTVELLNDEIYDLADEMDNVKRSVAHRLVEIGAVLLNREDFLRFTDVTSEIGDLCKGIAFRISEMMDSKWKIPMKLKNGMVDLSNCVFDTISKLRETLFTLNYGASNVSEKAKEVELAERKVDTLYRNLEIKILRSKLDLPTTLLTREVIELFEEIADKSEDAADAARILALTI
jgi:predicted phosphate transport protein (TIGR00153 family)